MVMGGRHSNCTMWSPPVRVINSDELEGGVAERQWGERWILKWKFDDVTRASACLLAVGFCRHVMQLFERSDSSNPISKHHMANPFLILVGFGPSDWPK